jgi:GT2 family glycosyltransferase
MKPDVSIIIVTHNIDPHIATCLKSLQALAYDPPPQVVIVDNGSHDESLSVIHQVMPEATILPQYRNTGFAGGVSTGVQASTGDIVVLLNPDTEVDTHWLDALVNALENPRCGVAGSKILDFDGKTLLHTGGSYIPTTLLTTHRGYTEPDRGQYDQPEAMPFVTGASMALWRKTWEQVGGIDIGFYPIYFEDLDLCLRIQDQGLECHYVPQSVLRHVESTTMGKYSGAFYYHNHRNRFRLACKRLSWNNLWNVFCPAEVTRLGEACLLDRMVAAYVYRQGLPQGIKNPDQAEQDAFVATGQLLASVREAQRNAVETWPTEVQNLLGVQAKLRAQMAPFIAEAQREAVLQEHQFHSRNPLVALGRRLWNSISTRWYVLPVLHQQTRLNLAMSRSIEQLVTHIEMDSTLLATLVYQAALSYRVASYQ